jgi:hypothetical protein
MSLDGQLENLTALYAEKSDDELVRMHGGREDLTEVAQQALADVLRARGLETRGAFAGQEPPRAGNGEGEEVLAPGETLLYMFHDAFEAREAMRVLTEAEIAHRILDWHAVDPEQPVSYTGLDLGLVAAKADAAGVIAVLREKLDLLPEGQSESDGSDGDAFQMISMFDRSDALVVARALGEGGFSFLWRDGREKGTDLPDGETVAIEVPASSFAAASAVVEQKLGGRG